MAFPGIKNYCVSEDIMPDMQGSGFGLAES
jgi:hypothetical protein